MSSQTRRCKTIFFWGGSISACSILRSFLLSFFLRARKNIQFWRLMPHGVFPMEIPSGQACEKPCSACEGRDAPGFFSMMYIFRVEIYIYIQFNRCRCLISLWHKSSYDIYIYIFIIYTYHNIDLTAGGSVLVISSVFFVPVHGKGFAEFLFDNKFHRLGAPVSHTVAGCRVFRDIDLPRPSLNIFSLVDIALLTGFYFFPPNHPILIQFSINYKPSIWGVLVFPLFLEKKTL